MYLKLEDKLNYIQEVLKMPYHFFTLTSDRSGILLYVENKEGKRFKFRGETIYDTVNNGEIYVREEVKKGIFKEPKVVPPTENEEDDVIVPLDEEGKPIIVSSDLSGTTSDETVIIDIDEKEKAIKTEEDYREALKLVEMLIAKDPDPESEEGEQLSILGALITDYESKLSCAIEELEK